MAPVIIFFFGLIATTNKSQPDGVKNLVMWWIINIHTHGELKDVFRLNYKHFAGAKFWLASNKPVEIKKFVPNEYVSSINIRTAIKRATDRQN
jgi:hypothetical protein